MVAIAMSNIRMALKNCSIVFAVNIFCTSLISTAAVANPLNTLSFSTPSKNIDCVYMEDDRDVPSLRCQTKFVLKPLPPKPADCDLDWGGGLTLANNGRVLVVCAGDTVAGDYATLAYGRAWEKNGLRCVASRSGLTCRSRNGKGFFLSSGIWKRV
jgi:hypothetical protein